MITFMLFIQRCIIILAIILCYFRVGGDEDVNCKLYPHHEICWEPITKKRATLTITYGSECEDNEETMNCITEPEENIYLYIGFSESKLLIAFLNEDMQKDIAQSARHVSKNYELDE